MRKRKNKNFNITLAVRIAMLHDLYTLPWQNNEKAKVNKFFNKHGFRHPIEAVINAINWYPELFEVSNEAKVIIDGIIHHMYPLPVTSFKENFENKIELKNYELLNNLSPEDKLMLIESSNRFKIGRISFSRSKYKEGRIMAKADKYVASKEVKNPLPLITGSNKHLTKNK